jgi:hypothetical protein
MVRVRLIAAILLGTSSIAHAQEELWTQRRGLITATGTITPGFLLQQPITNIYLSGHLEWFAEERISFRGRGSWFVDSQQDPALLRRNDQVSAGAYYHFGKDRLDIHAGLEPGISFAQLNAIPETTLRPVTVVPTVSLGGGVTFFIWDHFHFFAGMRYLRSALHGTPSGTLRLDELQISGGLGFQLKTGKRK